jgi:hypothetical protein
LKKAVCDVGGWASCIETYLKFKAGAGNWPYRENVEADFPLIGQTLGIVGDWGTGEHAAASLLTELKKLSPDTLIYLGDIYYSGTMDEVHDNFLSLCPEDSWLGFLAHRLRSFPCVRITTCTPVEADITG